MWYVMTYENLERGMLGFYGPRRRRARCEEEIEYYKSCGYELKTRIIERPTEDEFYWYDRERTRFNDGTYIECPFRNSYHLLPRDKQTRFVERWNLIYIYHWPHISTEEPGMIAYTATFEKGIDDVQTKIKPGRFLQKFFSDILSPEEIRLMAGLVGTELPKYELLFAKTADEIEWVYTHGPNSCMAYSVNKYRTNGVHPTRLYAGVFELAYFVCNGRATDRVLVWPEKKLYGRIYGSGRRIFKEKLEEAGYAHGGFYGAKLPKISIPGEPNKVLMPYIDLTSLARFENDHFVLGEGPIGVQITDGYINCYTCEGCKTQSFTGLRRVRVPDYSRTFNRWTDHLRCATCVEKTAFYCQSFGDYVLKEDRIEGHDGYGGGTCNYSYGYLLYSGMLAELAACCVKWPIRRIEDLDIEAAVAEVEGKRKRRVRPAETTGPTSWTTTQSQSLRMSTENAVRQMAQHGELFRFQTTPPAADDETPF